MPEATTLLNFLWIDKDISAAQKYPRINFFFDSFSIGSSLSNLFDRIFGYIAE
jgi:hypothetical protein